jgi:hypothetical protein
VGFSYKGFNVNISSETHYEAQAALNRSGFTKEHGSKAEVKKRLLSVSNELPIGAEVKIEKIYHPKRGYEPEAKFRSGESAEEETLRLVEHGAWYDPATGKPKEAKWERVSRFRRESGGRTPWVAFESTVEEDESMPRKPARRREPTPKEEGEQIIEAASKAGADYAHEQVGSPHFADWVYDQLLEAEEMSKRDPSSVFPVDTPAGARKAARNMLQQLEWDTKRQMDQREILKMAGADGVFGAGSEDWVRDTYGITAQDVTGAFFDAFDEQLSSPSTRQWLTDEILTRGEEIRGGEVSEARRPSKGSSNKAEWMRSFKDEAVAFGAHPGQIKWQDAEYLYSQGWTAKAAARNMYGSGVSEARQQPGMTPEQRSAVVAALRHYGADLTDDDHIKKGEKVLGVRVEVRKNRLRMVQPTGDTLASYPAANIGTGVADFVEKFWYWKPVGGVNEARGKTRYEVTVGADVIYSGDSLRAAQDKFDYAAHRNYEGSGYVDEVIQIKANGRVLRTFGPDTFRPHYFHPDPRRVDKGVTEPRMARSPSRRHRRRSSRR